MNDLKENTFEIDPNKPMGTPYCFVGLDRLKACGRPVCPGFRQRSNCLWAKDGPSNDPRLGREFERRKSSLRDL